uniref:Ribonuclease A-domain domain-containing protein n=1 Tax=Astatotilapia calliptera TaxID=8154 RepID=A0A3P8QH97_ASTCA
MRIMFAGLLLVLLFDTGLSKAANLQPKQQQKETPYEKFRRQHVDAKMSAEKCDAEIKNRQIYDVNSSCKFTNTFILSDDKEVKAICNEKNRGTQMSLPVMNESFLYKRSPSRRDCPSASLCITPKQV